MDILPPTDPKNPTARVKASRIRAKVNRNTASDDEVAWLNDYDAHREPESRGASAHRRTTFTEEESAAMGVGEAAAAAAAAANANAAWAREEGRQETSLADRGMAALERAFARQERMVEFMMARMQVIEESHLETLALNRQLYQDHTQAEIALMRKDAEDEGKGDQLSAMAAELLPVLIKQLNGRGQK